MQASVVLYTLHVSGCEYFGLFSLTVGMGALQNSTAGTTYALFASLRKCPPWFDVSSKGEKCWMN